MLLRGGRNPSLPVRSCQIYFLALPRVYPTHKLLPLSGPHFLIHRMGRKDLPPGATRRTRCRDSSSPISCSLAPCRVSSRLLLLGDTPLPPGAAEWRAGRGLSQQRAGHPSPLWLITQVVQLLTCDLLLSLRTALWQKQAGASQALGETYHASGAELAGFQRDLGSLRRLAHGFRPAYRKVRRTGRQGKAGRGPGTRGAQCGAAALALRGQTLAWVGRARTRLYSGFSNWYQSEKITLQLHLILF